MSSSCFSKSVIDDFLKKRNDLPESVKVHAKRAISSFDTPLDIFRTLDEFDSSPTPTYIEIGKLGCNELSVMNCHNGQRKLIMSVIEFVITSLRQLKCKDASELIVVYAGASGMAAVIAAKLFPGIQFVLYDPAPNTLALIDPSIKVKKVVYTQPVDKIDLNNELVIFTGKAGWFNEAVAEQLRTTLQPYTKSKHVVFISDIRVSNEESRIVDDMLSQQRFTHILRAEAYMFKFRIPYDNVDAYVQKYVEAYRSIKPRLPAIKKSQRELSSTFFPYIDGKLHIQLYARPETAELRLMGFAKKAAFAYRMYGTEEIENKMALFNLLYRNNARFAKGSSKEVANYETAAEHSIMEDVSAFNGKVQTASALTKQVDHMMSRFINKPWLACAIAGADAKLSKKKCDNDVRKRVDSCRK